MKRKAVFMNLNPDIYRQFKEKIVLEGKTVRDVIEKLMQEYVRREDGSSRNKARRA